MYSHRPLALLAVAFTAALLTACATSKPQPLQAEVELRAIQTSPADSGAAPITGELHFRQWQDEVVITGQVEHLPLRQAGRSQGRAMHIHEVGDCSGDAAGAGGIFNPTHRQHSWPGSGMVGDLPTVQPNAEGVATVNYLSPQVKLDGPNSVIGKAVIVHVNIDDWAIQPDGRAGPAMACGIIRAVEPKK